MHRFWPLVAALVVLAGCDARFVDLRPDNNGTGGPGDVDPLLGDADTTASPDTAPSETGPPPDADDADTSAPSDAGDATADSASPDTGTADTAPADTSPAQDQLVASGPFQDGPDYSGSGTAELWKLADGGWELRLGSDFKVDDVPGPVVVLSTREEIGSKIKPNEGDVELGVLESNSGASSYKLPFAPGPRRVAHIYCKPFGIEVIRADLEDQ